MSQQSEERLPGSPPDDPNAAPSARILHMKARNYDLQRAILQRAQESVEREQALDQEERRPKPLKWLIIAAIACIPVILTLTAVDGFLRAFYRYMDVATQSQPSDPNATSEPAPETTLQSNQPGVVLLQPFTVPEQAPAQESALEAQQSDSAAAPDK